MVGEPGPWQTQTSKPRITYRPTSANLLNSRGLHKRKARSERGYFSPSSSRRSALLRGVSASGLNLARPGLCGGRGFQSLNFRLTEYL